MTIAVTWEWLGVRPALDLANTVTVEAGRENDLLEGDGEYERWAEREAAALALSEDEARALRAERDRVLAARRHVRALVGALADGEERPEHAVAELNRLSRAAPEWVELDPATGRLRSESRAGAAARLVARYARDALALADDGGPLRRCAAPSCGMFYPPARPQQRWCSTQCGTRARVARHYRARHRE